jgi:predicted nuclease of predicted toxin-antitoxin system
MKLLVDECTGPAVARWLEQQGHDVFSVYDRARGIDDDKVIEIAQGEGRILITNDRGFGEKVFRERRPHHGVVFSSFGRRTGCQQDSCARSIA